VKWQSIHQAAFERLKQDLYNAATLHSVEFGTRLKMFGYNNQNFYCPHQNVW
jgi:hypothetical protein